MTQAIDDEPEGATPLKAAAREGLIPAGVTLRHELNEYEQENIAEARLWAIDRKRDPIDVRFCKSLHKRMYSRVWKWAGDYRDYDTNIGCDHVQIEQQLYQLVGSTRFWIENKIFEPDEIAVRYKHRLVQIHPFPNGNGRWSRLMGDVLARFLDRPVFSWGGSQLLDDDIVRQTYLAAVKKADGDDFPDLLAFARS